MLSLKKTLTKILLQIKNLIDMDTPERSDLAIADGITASTWTVKLNKYGGFCILQVSANISSTLTKNTETVITTLPTDARPITSVYAITTPQNVSDQTILFSIKSSGEITAMPRIRDHVSSDGFLRFAIAYPISYRGTT
jgi:hypothetical protein